MPESGQKFDKRERRQMPPLALRSVSHGVDIMPCCELADHAADRPNAELAPTLGNQNIYRSPLRLYGLDRGIHRIPRTEVFDGMISPSSLYPPGMYCRARRTRS